MAHLNRDPVCHLPAIKRLQQTKGFGQSFWVWETFTMSSVLRSSKRELSDTPPP